MHFTTTSPPEFPPETMVASELALPPVTTLPFDYEEIYEQWKLNRNRGGRGRGRGTSTQNESGAGPQQPADRSRSNGRWGEDDKWDKPATRVRSSVWLVACGGHGRRRDKELTGLNMALLASSETRATDSSRAAATTRGSAACGRRQRVIGTTFGTTWATAAARVTRWCEADNDVDSGRREGV